MCILATKREIMANELYDKHNPYSIFEYSKALLDKTLREAVGSDSIRNRKGKGQLGQLVEESFFNYQVNSNPTADFEEAGLELKCTPLKKLTSGELQIKERLVCCMIDYAAVVNEPFESSHLYHKCALMLLLFYLHINGLDVSDLKFLYSVLWKLPEKDLLIIRQDYQTIINKIKNGHAENLSEGDTIYLGACRKGSKGQKDVAQPYSSIKAPKRAFSLKPAYMRTVLHYVRESGSKAVCNFDIPLNANSIVTSKELQEHSFEEILLNRFKPYMGLDYVQICEKLQIPESINKAKYYDISNAIATNKGGDIDNSEEFQKSGIRLKTVRMECTGNIKESMSFENIDYQEVYSTNDWYDSRLYEIFSNRFLFVVYKQLGKDKTISIHPTESMRKEEKEYVLDKVFFWTMPQADLKIAEKYWLDIKKNIKNNKIALANFWSIKDHCLFHVRPKGTKSSYRTAINPLNGNYVDRYCYWFNSDYVKRIIESYSTE